MLLGYSGSIVEVRLKDELYTAKKVAVVAIYPFEDDLYTKSLKHLLAGMVKNQICICVMVNGSASTEISEILEEFKCNIFQRMNKGRDFGAYQDGINWLGKNELLQNIDRLFLVNDTLMWFEDSSEVVGQSMREDWHSIFLTLEDKAHAQSFFLSFSGTILKNPEFRKFWKRYAAVRYRKAAIVHGEMALSTLLLENGFICSTLVSPVWINAKFKTLNYSAELRQLLSFLEIKANPPKVEVPGAERGTWSIQEQIDAYMIEETENNEIEDVEFFSYLNAMLSHFAFSHAPHRIGIYLYLLFGLPMKADIYKIVSIANIASVIDFRNPESLHCASNFYISKSQRYMLGSRDNVRQKRRSEL